LVLGDHAEGQATFGLAIYLLGQCVEPAELEQELDRFLTGRLADEVPTGVDFDVLDWAG
jgi:hypothetical protein